LFGLIFTGIFLLGLGIGIGFNRLDEPRKQESLIALNQSLSPKTKVKFPWLKLSLLSGTIFELLKVSDV